MSIYKCENCRYADVSSKKDPCASCASKYNEKPTNWEPVVGVIMPTLLQCPFCGSTEEQKRGVKLAQQYGRANYYVMCHGCGVSTDYFSKSKDAINAWNRRA